VSALHAAVGITQGPGETANSYVFIARDPHNHLRHGEFVYYQAEERMVLGRISKRELARSLPDNLLADPAVSPDHLAGLLGLDPPPSGLYRLSVSLLGYLDKALGFVNPHALPVPGTPIYLAADAQLTALLSRLSAEATGAVQIGSLLTRESGRVPLQLDARGFTSTHLAIIASTGAGKSYLAGVIVEELMMPHNRAAVLVIDPHAEYDTLEDLQRLPQFAAADYAPQVQILRPADIKVRMSSLEIGDLRYLMPNLSEKMHNNLNRAFKDSRSGARARGRWTFQHLREAITKPADDTPEATTDPTVGALLWRVEALAENKLFDADQDLKLGELVRPGLCTILQLNEIPEREQRVIVATILRRLNQARMDTVRGRTVRGAENYLPYPVFVLIEEAHNYAPASDDIITSAVLKQILSEGRKFGLGVGLISQRPGKLDSDVLSQCMTQCILRVVNSVDQARIAESVGSVGRDLLDELPNLSKGQAIIAGASVNTPVLIQVRTRLTPHGAPDPDAPSQWRSYRNDEPPEPHPARGIPPGAYPVLTFHEDDPF